MTRFRITSRIASIVLAFSLLGGLLPASVSAETCTITSYTRYFYFYTRPNVDGYTRWFKVKLSGTGCYNGVHVFGNSVSTQYISKGVVQPGGPTGYVPALIAGPSIGMYQGRMDFRANWKQSDNWYDTYAYPRLKLSIYGAWSVDGTYVQCNFGLIGGSCYWQYSST